MIAWSLDDHSRSARAPRGAPSCIDAGSSTTPRAQLREAWTVGYGLAHARGARARFTRVPPGRSRRRVHRPPQDGHRIPVNRIMPAPLARESKEGGGARTVPVAPSRRDRRQHTCALRRTPNGSSQSTEEARATHVKYATSRAPTEVIQYNCRQMQGWGWGEAGTHELECRPQGRTVIPRTSGAWSRPRAWGSTTPDPRAMSGPRLRPE